eukprot:gene6418-6196_t
MRLVFDEIPCKPVERGGQFTVAVQIQDAEGNPMGAAKRDVTLTLAQGTGRLSGTTTLPVSYGEAMFSDLVYTGADSFTLLAKAGSLETTSDPVHVNAGGDADV